MAFDPLLEPNRYIAQLARKRKEQEQEIARALAPSSPLYAQAMGASARQEMDPRRPGAATQVATDAAIAPDARVRAAMEQRAKAQAQAHDAELPAVRQPPQYQQPAQRGFFKKLFDSIGRKDPNAQADAEYQRQLDAQKFLRDQESQNYQLETQRQNATEQSAALEQYRAVRAQQIAAQMAAAEESRNPESLRSELARKLAAPYADPQLIAGASEDQILKLMPFLKAEIDKEEAALKHAQRMQQQGDDQAHEFALEGERQAGRLELQDMRGSQQAGIAGMQAQERVKARVEAFKHSYAKERELELDIAGMLQDIEASPGGAAPAGFAERFSRAITARGIDPDRIETWQSKQMVLELWSRNQSGAAIGMSEGDRFKVQAGLSETATPEQVEAAVAVMRRLVARRLRATAAANPSAARDVATAQGLNVDAWLGKQKAAAEEDYAADPAPSQRAQPARPAKAPKRKPAAASAGDDEWQDVGGSSRDDDEWEDL